MTVALEVFAMSAMAKAAETDKEQSIVFCMATDKEGHVGQLPDLEPLQLEVLAEVEDEKVDLALLDIHSVCVYFNEFSELIRTP